MTTDTAPLGAVTVLDDLFAREEAVRAGKSTPCRTHRSYGQALLAGLLALCSAVAWTVMTWQPARWLIYLAWTVPLIELGMMAAGHVWYRRHRAGTDTHRSGCSEMIIQITTAGKDPARVREILNEVRSYELDFPCQLWVVTEPPKGLALAPGTSRPWPGCRDGQLYPAADLVITVPPDFRAKADHKARALEYSRQYRAARCLDRPDVKILFNDDDVTLTRGYVQAAWESAHQLSQGIVAPRTYYGTWPLGHMLASHADDIRTLACWSYCSVFQGILQSPLHVHGEGLCVTGDAEKLVTWDWPCFASEDLVFGRKAAEAGMTWGWFREYAEGTSPWTIRDFVKQRRRWLWGDIHGITHREVMSRRTALLTAGKYLAGTLSVTLALTGLWMRASGQIPAGSTALEYAKLPVIAWAGMYFAAGWAGASPDVREEGSDDSRLLAGVISVLLMPVSAGLTIASVLISLAMGKPETFEVIAKTRGSNA